MWRFCGQTPLLSHNFSFTDFLAARIAQEGPIYTTDNNIHGASQATQRRSSSKFVFQTSYPMDAQLISDTPQIVQTEPQLKKFVKCMPNRSTTETVKGAALSLQGVDNVERCDRLSLGVLPKKSEAGQAQGRGKNKPQCM